MRRKVKKKVIWLSTITLKAQCGQSTKYKEKYFGEQ